MTTNEFIDGVCLVRSLVEKILDFVLPHKRNLTRNKSGYPSGNSTSLEQYNINIAVIELSLVETLKCLRSVDDQ